MVVALCKEAICIVLLFLFYRRQTEVSEVMYLSWLLSRDRNLIKKARLPKFRI